MWDEEDPLKDNLLDSFFGGLSAGGTHLLPIHGSGQFLFFKLVMSQHPRAIRDLQGCLRYLYDLWGSFLPPFLELAKLDIQNFDS